MDDYIQPERSIVERAESMLAMGMLGKAKAKREEGGGKRSRRRMESRRAMGK
jgi:hypothetical protein